MAWKSLNDRLSDLPLVLAGPILRRTDETSVTVWVALKKPATVTLDVLETGSVGPPRAWPRKLTSAATRTIRLGEWLHVTALTTTPDSALASILEPATTYAYNLRFDTSGYRSDLLDADVLTGRLAEVVDISYFDHGLPTFVLPPADLDKVRLAHGSCRKPHDPGRDGLAILDLLVDSAKEDPEERPQQLFLTGDQIYAEEVVDPLLWLIMDAVKALMAWSEILPDGTALETLRPGTRANILQQKAGLEYHDPKTQLNSHVIGLAEYYAMYLLAWSQALWPIDLPTYREAGAPRSGWNDGIERLEEFRKDIPAVRRVLANVPTYMIFDDHDVTDDWYISKRWCDQVLGSELGKRLVQNALIAYAIFQHWGNVPADFRDGRSGAALLAKVENLPTGTDMAARLAINNARDEIDRYIGLPPGLVELHRWAARDVSGTIPPMGSNDDEVFLARDDAALQWDYVVTGPKYEVIVLDTRTWRGHRRSAPKDPPSMLSSVAFSRQLTNRPELARPGIELTCVIATTNPVGIGIHDWLQGVYADRNYSKAIGTFDYGDAWKFHEAAFATLLSTLFAGRRRVVVLSGDLHVGYAAKVSYWATKPFNGSPRPQAGVLAQLTASAFKNADSMGIFSRIAHTKLKQLKRESPETWAAWSDRPELYTPFTVTDDEDGTTERRWAAVNLPDDAPFVTELKNGVELRVRDEAQQPDWCFRIEFARRRRTPGQPRAAFVLPTAGSVDDALGWLTVYASLNTLPLGGAGVIPGAMVVTSPWFQEGTEIVGLHNVGIVSFKWPGAMGKTVSQHLYFWPPGATEVHTLGRYQVSLDVEPEVPKIAVEPGIP